MKLGNISSNKILDRLILVFILIIQIISSSFIFLSHL